MSESTNVATPMITEDRILADAEKGVTRMKQYHSFLARKQKDGTLTKALQSCAMQYVNIDLNQDIRKFVVEAMVRLMQSIGEYNVPLWAVPSEGFRNVRFKAMFDDAMQTLNQATHESASVSVTTGKSERRDDPFGLDDAPEVKRRKSILFTDASTNGGHS